MSTKEDLKYFQSMPLDIKVAMTRTRIREWVNAFGESGVYVSFSGGKDSTVLLHLVRELYPDVPAVFVNTGLEYPEIQAFVKTFNNVIVVYPEKPFYEVLKTNGYPMISKAISHNISIARRNPDGSVAKNIVFNENKSSKFCAYKYKDLVNADFLLSRKCCDIIKKNPVQKFEHDTGRKAIIATMAIESAVRESAWLKDGCNSFESDRPISKPMSFWTEQDVLRYAKINNIKLASVYGDIIPENGQLNMFEDDSECKLCTTGAERTGCIFCGFGAHLEKGEGRFKRLKETHPKQYNYCIRGGEYDIDGLWKPNKDGLGMGHVFDELNKLYSKGGKPFIDY